MAGQRPTPASLPREPRALAAHLRKLAPRRFYFAERVTPSQPGSREYRHHTSDSVRFLERAPRNQEVLLHLAGGHRVTVPGPFKRVLNRFTEAGYRFISTHRSAACRLDLIETVEIDRPPIDLAQPAWMPELDAELDFGDLPLEAEPLSALPFAAPTPIPFRTRRHRLLLQDSPTPCPLVPGQRDADLRQALQTQVLPSLRHLAFVEPESHHERLLREFGLITLGGSQFWRHALDPSVTPEEHRAFRRKWRLHLIPPEITRRIFTEQEDPSQFIPRRILRNAIWQPWQWVTSGFIDSIRDAIEEDQPGAGPEPTDDPPHHLRKIKIRTFWYKWAKHAVYGWNLDITQGDEYLNRVMIELVKKRLVRYRDLDIVDASADDRHLGPQRPELLLITEKDTVEDLVSYLATPLGISWMILVGQMPMVTANYYLDALAEQGIDLATTPFHIFGVVDLNPGGASILQSAKNHLELFGARQVLTHNLVQLQDIPAATIETNLVPVCRYREVWEQFPDRRGRSKNQVFLQADDGYLTQCREWHKNIGYDPRFHKVEDLGDGLKQETYYGLDIENISNAVIINRFRTEIAPLISPALLAKHFPTPPHSRRCPG